MRGKPPFITTPGVTPWNIPAYAGKTYHIEGCGSNPWEHPRVCGENATERTKACLAEGTSPRMRGKPAGTKILGGNAGNIPAYAGKTVGAEDGYEFAEEHPRVCGENIVWVVA